jgi:hypothetical protein
MTKQRDCDDHRPEHCRWATNLRRRNCCGGRVGRGVVPLGGDLLDAGASRPRRWHRSRQDRGLISSGVPISQSEPDALARELLAARGLALFGDCSVGPCTHSRRGIGYVTGDAEPITLARLVAAEAGVHPVALAAQWVAGRSPPTLPPDRYARGSMTTGGPAPGGAFAAHRLAD